MQPTGLWSSVRKRSRLCSAAAIAIAALQVSGCDTSDPHAVHAKPVSVEYDANSGLGTVTLTAKGAERIGLKTVEIMEQSVSRSSTPRLTVPYSSLIYDPQGGTWVYASPAPLIFMRKKIDIDYIEGDVVILNSGPEVGTVVASVGVAEIYGSEFAVGH